MQHLRLCFITLMAKCKERNQPNMPFFLSNCDSASLSRGKVTLPLFEGRNLFFASKEVELERTIPRSQFLSGLCFGKAPAIMIASPPVASNTHAAKKFTPPSSNSRGRSETSHKLEVEGESIPTSDNKLSIITNQPSTHWIVNWYIHVRMNEFSINILFP
jgi:DNA repair and recombination protein RAD54B